MSRLRKIILVHLVTLVIVLMATHSSIAQEKIPDSILKSIPFPELGPNDTIPVPAQVYQNHEIIPSRIMEWIWVSAPYPKHLLEKRREWTRLRNAVYVTYPYARKAGLILNDINAKLAVMKSGEKKKYIKTREKELKKEFADPLTELSVYQGKILMKLINRQTGNNCYDIIKEYQGGFTARIWQTVAFFFSSNLKQPYDAPGEDKVIEGIVQEVERMYRVN